jgi:elongation factor P--(R)-beta-lysine ligase
MSSASKPSGKAGLETLSAKRFCLEFRCRIIRAIRSFFEAEGFLEVETPLLTRAPAPEPHITPVPAAGGSFLITSPELHMKRLLAAGYEKIFQITRAFRGGERGRLHHPEFAILEWYRSGADYKDLQEDCQKLVRSVCKTAGNPRGLDPGNPWERYTVQEAFARFARWEPGPSTPQTQFDMDLVEKVEPNLGFPRPCILEDYPASQAALARLKPGNPQVAERFELYWAGIELANGFSELTDPAEQRSRFQDVLNGRRKLGLTAGPLPEEFLESLPHLAPCAGIAFGVDRFVMLLAGASSLDAVTAFTPEAE